MNLNTSNKLKILIGIFLIGFISMFSVNQFFNKLISDLDKQTVVHESKIKIGEYVAEDIQTLKALFFELALTTSTQRSRQIVQNKMKNVINNINNALNVLEKGGNLKRKIALNVAGQEATFHNVLYDISQDDTSLPLEVIDIRPKIIEFNSMVKEVSNHMAIRYKYVKNKESAKLLKFSKKLRRYYKTAPPFFDRMSENIKRLLFEGENELEKIRSEIYSKQNVYLQIKLILLGLVTLITTLVGVWLGQTINKENEKLLQLNNDLETKERFVKAILNGQENMVIVSDGIEMIEANDFIAEFFDEFETIADFKSKYECICDKFEPSAPNSSYITKKEYGDKTWLEYILDNPDKHFKTIMNSGSALHHFSIVANKKTIDSKGNFIIVVSLSDITNEMNSQLELSHLNDNLENLIDLKTKELKDLNNSLEERIKKELEKNRAKDKQMIQQSRFAALGEMIGNIAHQWRQPLSAISSTASSVEMQMELGIADEKDIKKSYTDIKNYVAFLTQTIEDFRGFFQEDKEKTKFDIKTIINQSVSIISATYKDNNLTLDIDLPSGDLNSIGMPNELSQVFLNLLNNARDAIKEKDPKNRLVAIFSQQTEDEHIIYIQDNAGGIPEDILDKIFDPYFTTKHQSQGTGIGLYMSKEIIEKHMEGSITAYNKHQTINGHEYNGACFEITLPIFS
ncbi:MAG TPA: GHKL domain-containing protein [Arcobacter sp.]|jgi:signal transduction histidine kinase|nr:GHKL domain-containing protein [Arcobacter sp.]